MPMCLVTVHRPLPVRHNAPTERRSAGTNRNQRLNRITALTKRARSGKKRRKRKRKRKHQPRKSMWRRVTSLSPLLLSPKPTLLDRAGHGLQSLEPLSTQIPPPVKEETSSAEKTPFITFVLGGPGSGKGTQCIKIAETFGFTHLSAGDLLRNEMLSTSEYGAMILDKMRRGKIVPSEVTVKLLQREMESNSNHKFLIDGFPRSEENRVAYDRIIGAEPNMVLFFDCPEEEMIKRVLNRNQGRVDDKIDIVKKRLKVFEALTLPVINYYSKKGKLYKINAVGTVDEIFEQVHPVFAECKANK